MHRGEIGDARTHAQDPLAPFGRVMRDESRHLGARSDQAHGAAQHVNELGQFVQFVATQPAPASCNAGVTGHRQFGTARRFHGHGSELEYSEVDTVPAHPLLPVEHRAACVELDDQRNKNKQRRQNQQAHAREDQVNRALDHAWADALPLRVTALPAPFERPAPRARRPQRSCVCTRAD